MVWSLNALPAGADIGSAPARENHSQSFGNPRHDTSLQRGMSGIVVR
jgi:hypothetical protein